MKKVIAIGAIVLIVLVGIFAYSFLREPEAASGPIETAPLEINQETEAVAETEPVVESSSGQGLTVFQISQEDSLVRFELDEDFV